jgi:hypothetical protein
MPARLRRGKRRHRANVTPEAVEIFRRGLDNPHDQHLRIALAAALGRSKFAASPLDARPRSLIGCDTEPIEDVLHLRAQLLKQNRRYMPFGVQDINNLAVARRFAGCAGLGGGCSRPSSGRTKTTSSLSK